jgi:hypothetical protein
MVKKMTEKSTWELIIAKRIKQISEVLDFEKQLNEIKKTTLDLKERSQKQNIETKKI